MSEHQRLSVMARIPLLLVALTSMATLTPAFNEVPKFDGPPSFELLNYDPIADPAAVVTSSDGKARFTVLTDRLIRMEYSDSKAFEDRPTVAILNRKLAVPSFKQDTTNGVLTISIEGGISLEYTEGQPFTASSLKVQDSKGPLWFPGKPNSGNLLGTIKSLDQLGVTSLNCTENANITVHDESLHCQWGLISRDNWALVDDSDNWALTTGAEWWDSENADQFDWYIFAHGHDYKGAIQDFVKIGGKTPMVPRYALGIWWTRWYDMNARDVKHVVADYTSRDIPLDVFVLDMDWHSKNAWGGYTFDTHLFPYPEVSMHWLKYQGLHTAANIHDDDGMNNWELQWSKFCDAMGVDPSSTSKIDFSIVNKTYVYALEDIVLQNLEKTGIDLWWIDWQQGGTQGGAKGGKQNPTIWTDKIRVTDAKRRGDNTRGIVLARWGGLGNHRYNVGFSGDVKGLTWENLAYQPYFSFTASNVAYGFISHDIVGPAGDHEMYVRWIQWAAYSGVLRSHDRGMSAGDCANADNPSCPTVKVWNIPTKYFEANRAAMQRRVELVPYLYTAARQAFDTGLGPLRPMYYEYPECEQSYYGNENGDFPQYFFGDDMIVSPIVKNATNGIANQTIFLPPGVWYEEPTGVMYNITSATVMTKGFALTEVPVFVRAGRIIPTIPYKDASGNVLGRAAKQYDALTLTVYPGTASSFCTVYEDDGTTTDYLQGKSATTTVRYSTVGTTMTLTANTNGSYPELPQSRTYTIRVLSAAPPNKVVVNGQDLPFDYNEGPSSWSYCGDDIAIVIRAQSIPITTELSVTVTLSETPSISAKLLDGLKGMISHANLAKMNLDETRQTPGAHTTKGGELMIAASVGDTLEILAGPDMKSFMDLVSGYPSQYEKAIAEVKNMTSNAGHLDYAYPDHRYESEPISLGQDSAGRIAYSLALLANGNN